MTVSRVAASLRRAAEEALRTHKQACLPCSKAAKDQAACPVGMNLASHAELMRQQEEMLNSPLGPDYVQDKLW